jgi:hypothetical protein
MGPLGTPGPLGDWSKRPSDAGLSLIEVLIAATLTCLVLAASFGWLSSVVSASDHAADHVEVSSSLAFARRLTTSELRQASALVAVPTAPCGRHTISFALPSVANDGTYDLITYTWDAGRNILWRKASGSYVAQGVTHFEVHYFGSDGRELAPLVDVLPLSAYASVRAVSFVCTVRYGQSVQSAVWRVVLRASAQQAIVRQRFVQQRFVQHRMAQDPPGQRWLAQGLVAQGPLGNEPRAQGPLRHELVTQELSL